MNVMILFYFYIGITNRVQLSFEGFNGKVIIL